MRNPWKVTSFVFAAVLAAAVGQNMINSASAEPQPRMREALESLRGAARSLEAADHDKGGHRAKALELTRGAIAQVEEGIRFDNRH
jgi:hypothetical protein